MNLHNTKTLSGSGSIIELMFHIEGHLSVGDLCCGEGRGGKDRIKGETRKCRCWFYNKFLIAKIIKTTIMLSKYTVQNVFQIK